LLILVGYKIADPWSAVLVIGVAAMIGSFGAPCAYAITMDMGGKHIPPVFSLMNMSGNFGAALFPQAVGWVLDTYGTWEYVMLGFIGIYFAAALCWIPFNANGTIVKERPAHAS
jgi:MFS family permease